MRDVQSTQELEDQIAAGGAEPLLVGFGAAWSGPWKLIGAVLKDLEERGTRIVRVDVDNHPGLADRYAVVSVPTFVVMVEGKEVRRYLGAVSASELEAGLVLNRSASRSAGRSGMRRRR